MAIESIGVNALLHISQIKMAIIERTILITNYDIDPCFIREVRIENILIFSISLFLQYERCRIRRYMPMGVSAFGFELMMFIFIFLACRKSKCKYATK